MHCQALSSLQSLRHATREQALQRHKEQVSETFSASSMDPFDESRTEVGIGDVDPVRRLWEKRSVSDLIN